jgi:tatD-related deoxyribonuclease
LQEVFKKISSEYRFFESDDSIQPLVIKQVKQARLI